MTGMVYNYKNFLITMMSWKLWASVLSLGSSCIALLFMMFSSLSPPYVLLYPSTAYEPLSSVEIVTAFHDPLEQFDVLSLSLPLVGAGFTNLALLLVVNLLVMAVWFGSYGIQVANNYDFALRVLYQLVRGLVKENLYIRKHQYFTVLFYLFFTLLLANLVGMIPYSFTITSSFIVTFFLAATHFVAINHVAVVKHQWQTNDLFLPSGAPLLIAPFLIFIEAVSYIARVFSLSIRLFANMMSGHALLKILIGFS
jgi:F-type H+-transporting ATPase subunit a